MICTSVQCTDLDDEEGPNRADQNAVDGDADERVYEQDPSTELSLRCNPPVTNCCDGGEREEHRVVEAP